jgi:hypothetical protein
LPGGGREKTGFKVVLPIRRMMIWHGAYDMSEEEIIAAADELRKQVEKSAALVESSLHRQTPAEALPPSSPGPPPASPDDDIENLKRRMERELEERKEFYRREVEAARQAVQREVDIETWKCDSSQQISSARVLMATAMGRHLDKAALASADALEFAAVTKREISGQLDVALSEQDVYDIKEAIKYVRSCRTQVGLL